MAENNEGKNQKDIISKVKSTGLRRTLEVIVGIGLIPLGILFLFTPGPGVLILVAGFNLIKPNNFIVRWIRRKVPCIPESGPIPKKYIIYSLIIVVIFTLLGIFIMPKIWDYLVDLFSD